MKITTILIIFKLLIRQKTEFIFQFFCFELYIFFTKTLILINTINYQFMRIKNRKLKFIFAFLLIIILLGYKYIINIPQTLQSQIMKLHKVPQTQFNLLYSLQTLPTIFLIIPLGILYDSFGPKMLIPASLLVVCGQILLYIYTPLQSKFSFIMMIIGRVIQGVGAEVLYLGQGSLATKWMGNLVGMIVVLPQVGEIGNVFLSPEFFKIGGLGPVMLIGLFFCIISWISSIFLYCLDKKCEKEYKIPKQLIETEQSQIKLSTFNQFSRLFWILILICAVNQSIYMPFMDNANQLIRQRFCIKYQNTGYYLSLPFIAAMISTAVFGFLLQKFSKKYLALLSGILGLVSHLFIYIIKDCECEKGQTNQFMPAFGFIIFGIGIGSYYSIIYPLVGLSVKRKFRGTAYAMVSFVQAIGMSIVPQISGFIIQDQKVKEIGYKNSSVLFILLSLIGIILSIILSSMNNDIMNNIGNIEQQKKFMNLNESEPNTQNNVISSKSDQKQLQLDELDTNRSQII